MLYLYCDIRTTHVSGVLKKLMTFKTVVFFYKLLPALQSLNIILLILLY